MGLFRVLLREFVPATGPVQHQAAVQVIHYRRAYQREYEQTDEPLDLDGSTHVDGDGGVRR
jgi:hypothetical protein